MENKSFYIANTPKNLPIFHQPFYLEAVTGGQWDVCLVKSNDNSIVASLPYYKQKVKNYLNLTQPPLCQCLGPWINKEYLGNLKMTKYYSLVDELYSQLSEYDYYEHNWHYSLNNWLPLYWKGFEQTTYYTSVSYTHLTLPTKA